ncbi:MAG: sulfatase-like hydrolase/transferase [Acidobacteriales bacterium]|nr:sulfatase-like hydrolase/transferase [Terriglobales bacterium]
MTAIDRRTWLRQGGALCASKLLAAPAKRPNVVFLFTDDQRADTVSALGNPHIRTPNLDALCRSGMVFRNAYCMGGNSPAVCLPSRNMLLSGRTFFRYGLTAPADAPNFPDAMRAADYETYHHGKRGNTALLIQARFEYNKYLDDKAERLSGEPGKQIVDEAIRFLREPHDRPVFMYLAFGNPHDPRVAARRYLDLYDPARIPLPRNFLPVHPFDNGEMVIRDELLAPWPRTPEEIRRQLAEYWAVVTGLDENIGRLIACMKESGIYDNTIIVFSSDQGIALGSHGLMGKQNLYEDSMHVPLFIRGSGITPGITGAMVYLMDIFPTILELVGAAAPPGLDGRSYAPVVRGRARKARDSIFLAYRDVQRALREERYKLIVYPKAARRQLFDLVRDPDETRDLASEPAHQARINAMLDRLRLAQKQFGDTAPLSVPNPGDGVFRPPTGDDLNRLLKSWGMTRSNR